MKNNSKGAFIRYVLCFLAGFTVGGLVSFNVLIRQPKIVEKTTIIKGDPIHIEVPVQVATKETPPKKDSIKILPVYKDDTIVDNTIEPVNFSAEIDSLKATIRTLQDWNTLRNYSYTLFDISDGKLGIKFNVQYNKVVSPISVDFTPTRHITTKTVYPTWQPYVGYTWTNIDYHIFDAGTFYHNLGINAVYIQDFKGTSGYGFGLKYKF